MRRRFEASRSSVERRRLGLVSVTFLSFVVMLVPPEPASARHRARLLAAEPIFTQRSFVEKDLELDLGWEKDEDSDLFEPALGNTWVFGDWLETAIEIPFGVRAEDGGSTSGGLSDVAFGLQALLCCPPGQLLDWLSVRGDVEAPTGSRAKDVGGTGSFTFSLLPGRLFILTEAEPDLFVEMQLAYAQEIRPGEGSSGTVEKDFLWNLAFTMTYLNGRVRPVFELLGTSVLDAADPADEGSILELAPGVWIAPFPDDHWLSPVSFGFGYRWPVTTRRDDLMATLWIVEYAID